MPVKWKIFRIICVLQMLASSVFGLLALMDMLKDFGFGNLVKVILYVFIFLLTVLAMNVINNNYPDTPVTGNQKSNFNWLFLLNFLFLVFLFGIIFAEFRDIRLIALLMGRDIFDLPVGVFTSLFINLGILILQFYLLYGMYDLRRELYFNFRRKEFEFEKENK
jgi:hypothetical protein